MESEAKPETAVQQRMVTLRPIAMITPTREGIYAPSRLRQGKTISYIEFLTKFADRPRPIRVSFAPDCVSNPQIVTAYGCGRDCWYIVDGNENLS